MPKVKWRDPGTREWQEREFIRREDARAHAARLARLGIPHKGGVVYERARPGDVEVEELWAWGNPRHTEEVMARGGGEFDWEEWGEEISTIAHTKAGSRADANRRARREMRERQRQARAEAAKRVRTAKK
jgi:hypothetical protein